MAGGGAAILAGGRFAMSGSASSLLGNQGTVGTPVASPSASPVASPAASGSVEVGMVDIAFEVTDFRFPPIPT